MTPCKFQFSFKTIARRLTVLLVGVMVWFSVAPAIAAAHPTTSPLESPDSVLLARAASSRFAAQKENEGLDSRIPASKFEEMREQRREWQSEASATAAEEAAEAAAEEESAGEAIKDKLNLKEITEENEILD